MECNKDEAVRAKQLAESRMQTGQFTEALKFANKAKKLYADVDNIAQILAICEVHIAALNKLYCSEMDWYRILQTERLSEDAIIKKQYRKLALLLHPDKNKFPGAEAAFKLIGEANRVLSDQAKRSLHDMKVKADAGAAVSKTSSRHSNGNMFAANQVPNASSSNFPSRNPHLNAQQTFWTMCQPEPSSKQRFNTRNDDENKDVNVQENHVDPSSLNVRRSSRQKQHVSYVETDADDNFDIPFKKPRQNESFNNDEVEERSVSEETVLSNTSRDEHSDVQEDKACATGVRKQHKDEKSKDGYVPVSKPMESQASKNVGSKRMRQPEPGSKQRFNTRNDDENKDVNVQENHVDPSSLNVRRSSRQKRHVSYVEYADDNFDVPSKKPRQNESFNNDEVEEKKVSEEETVLSNTSGDKHSDVQEDKVLESDLDSKMLNEETCSPPNSNIPSSPEIITCPDPDFSNFEKDKADDCFAANQLWAIYDHTGALPRFYALIKKVTFPFKLHIIWLEPDPDEDDEVAWYDADLPIACGKFILDKSQKTTDRSMFSHQIQFIKGNNRDSYLVFPKKGETWAIFRNWDIKWSYNPENDLKREFDYVEILSNFTENVGIEVAYLGKVKGFISLFEKTGKNGENTFCILPNELYRFSHQIPSYKMNGDEREGVPRGCFELDPAALPTEMFEAEKDSREKVEKSKVVDAPTFSLGLTQSDDSKASSSRPSRQLKGKIEQTKANEKKQYKKTVHQQNDEGSSDDGEKVKGKKLKEVTEPDQRLRHKMSIPKVYILMQSVNTKKFKKKIVEELNQFGFGGMLHICNWTRIHTFFVDWIVNNFEKDHMWIRLRNTEVLELKEDDVHRVYELPMVGKKINTDLCSDAAINRLRRELGLTENSSPFVKVTELERVLNTTEKATAWVKGAICYIIHNLLCPTNHSDVSLQYAHILVDAATALSHNWCSHILEYMKEGLQSPGVANPLADFHFLMINYLDKMGKRSPFLTGKYKHPSLRDWDVKMANQDLQKVYDVMGLENGLTAGVTRQNATNEGPVVLCFDADTCPLSKVREK
ncbi:uncharacterized protein LOC123896967 isoform X3 [Trifolium pratense]|uniref:uncharacterized protein LOC123896967 isoform X3 n=1 Tax=Trifolium pratense TaxID=57577 RepID=UPI001E692858|nr:uncharacterized protein LOC123896967 isoform X3 [Trifolium pratense]